MHQGGVGKPTLVARAVVCELEQGRQGRARLRAVGRHPKDRAIAVRGPPTRRSIEGVVTALYQGGMGSAALVARAIAREFYQSRQHRAQRCAVGRNPEDGARVVRTALSGCPVKGSITALHQRRARITPSIARSTAGERDQSRQRRPLCRAVGCHPKHRAEAAPASWRRPVKSAIVALHQGRNRRVPIAVVE